MKKQRFKILKVLSDIIFLCLYLFKITKHIICFLIWDEHLLKCKLTYRNDFIHLITFYQLLSIKLFFIIERFFLLLVLILTIINLTLWLTEKNIHLYNTKCLKLTTMLIALCSNPVSTTNSLLNNSHSLLSSK